ncbi:MAG: hypothetical protein ABIE70_07100 [bacterium]
MRYARNSGAARLSVYILATAICAGVAVSSALPPPGDCANCIQVWLDPSTLPLMLTDLTTCGMENSYDQTCLDYWDGGQDVIFEVTVTQPAFLDIELDPFATDWSAMALSNLCPPNDNSCIAISIQEDGSNIHSLGPLFLEAGVYYLMVDTWPLPDCIPIFSLHFHEVHIPCCLIRGDLDDNGLGPDIADLIYMVGYMFHDGPPPSCLDHADVNGDGGLDITDLVDLVGYMFQGGAPPLPCPQPHVLPKK